MHGYGLRDVPINKSFQEDWDAILLILCGPNQGFDKRRFRLPGFLSAR
jgi:hypothetical protein